MNIYGKTCVFKILYGGVQTSLFDPLQQIELFSDIIP